MSLLDIQNHNDDRGIDIDHVGVSDLLVPVSVFDPAKGRQATVATVRMSVGLPSHLKGTHMSRFVEVFNAHRNYISSRTLLSLVAALKARLGAESARVEVEFPYFIERAAPVSGASGLVDYTALLRAEATSAGTTAVVGVRVPVTSLCPCSKAISDRGAHNQRGYISIEAREVGEPAASNPLWVDDMVAVAEVSASAPVYALLKREDERYVTMQAYDNPVFVEDMVRNVATAIKRDARIAWAKVYAVNHESIHNHSAFAQVEWSRTCA